MFDDFYIVAIWVGIVFSISAATHHLLRWAGVLIASQGAMLLLGAFTFTVIVRIGFSAVIGVIGSVLICGILGLAHRYVLYVVGPLLFVLLCIAGDILLAEIWLAVPNITGGSGGLLIPKCDDTVALISITICVAFAAIVRMLTGSETSFWWATVRTHGWHSGLFGVDDRRSLALFFIGYGIIAGFCGSAMAASLGYVAPSGLHLPFTMAIVMIASASPTPGTLSLITLSFFYGSIRTVLRQSIAASPTRAVFFEVSFPILLILIVYLQFIYRSYGGEKKEIDNYLAK